MAAVKGVLFDLDGVLLDSMAWHVKAWQEIFSRMGVEIEAEFIYLHEGALERSTLSDILAEQGCPNSPQAIEELLRRQVEHFTASYSELVKPYPQAASVLKRLAEAGQRLALVTSSSWPVVEKSVPAEILEPFDVVITSDKVSNFKPHPEPYATALDRLSLAPKEAVAVENAPAGIRSAKGAGLYCYGLTTTLEPCHLNEADVVIGSLEELVGRVLNGRRRDKEDGR